MRIVIAAPRKSGSAILRCLLSQAYGLDAVPTRDAPDGSDLDAAALWMAELPDQSVATTSFPFSTGLADAAGEHAIALLAILRHPFDLLASIHDVAQQQAKRRKKFAHGAGPGSKLAGLAIDDPGVLDYVRDDFGNDFAWLENWSGSGFPTVRYELLESDPDTVLAVLAPHLGALDDAAIAHAVQLCPPENVVVSRPFRGRRMPALPADTWRAQLPAAVMQLLREQYGDATRRLGYDPS